MRSNADKSIFSNSALRYCEDKDFVSLILW